SMALSDETNFGYVKQLALDWREATRERRYLDMISSTSLVAAERSDHRVNDSKSRGRGNSLICAERRSSSFYRQSFSKGNKAVEIERRAGNTESDRIRVSTDVSLYLHQPVPLNDALRASLK
ncbi:hypothetical protein KR032_009106, partial [Drosophila birchii]